MHDTTSLNHSAHSHAAEIMRRIVIVTITVAVVFANGGRATAAAARLYDGVTLYQGLYFGSGPVVGIIPSLRKAAPRFPADYKSLEPQTIRYIQAKDPNFFRRFAAEVQSGDRVRVAHVLKSAHEVHMQALLAVTKTSRSRIATRLRRLQEEPDKGPAEKDSTVVAVDLDKDKSLIAIILDGAIVTSTPDRELKGITFEQYVDEIVRAVPNVKRVTR